MKKIVAVLVSIFMIGSFSVSVFAAEEVDGITDLPMWNETEDISEEFYIKTEPASASAIVNTDSFVDKIAGPSNFELPCKGALLMDETTGQVLYAKNENIQQVKKLC